MSVNKLNCSAMPSVDCPSAAASTMRAVAAFYREAQAGMVTGEMTGDGHGKATTTTELNGKAVVNPLQQAMEAGICEIVG